MGERISLRYLSPQVLFNVKCVVEDIIFFVRLV